MLDVELLNDIEIGVDPPFLIAGMQEEEEPTP
jgi:hypothetical protein